MIYVSLCMPFLLRTRILRFFYIIIYIKSLLLFFKLNIVSLFIHLPANRLLYCLQCGTHKESVMSLNVQVFVCLCVCVSASLHFHEERDHGKKLRKETRFKRFIYFYCMCLCAYVYVCTPSMSLFPQRPEKTPVPMKLDLWAIANHLM